MIASTYAMVIAFAECGMQMLKSLTQFVYGSFPAEFVSDFPLDESVRRLSLAVKPTPLHALFGQAAVGHVLHNRVSLRRVISFCKRPLAPRLVGDFQEQDGRVVLKGRFSAPLLEKAFITFWFGGCLFMTLVVASLFLSDTPKNGLVCLGGLGMFALGCLLLQVCKWCTRKDVAWLSDVIERALRDDPHGNRTGEGEQGTQLLDRKKRAIH